MRKTFLIFTAALLLTPALAAPVLAQPAPPPASVHGHGGKMHGFFTPEQRAMMMMGARDQIREMTPDQRHAWRHDQMAKIRAMSPDQQDHFKADLQARFDALPPGAKDRIEQRIAMRQQGQPVQPLELNPNAGSAVTR